MDTKSCSICKEVKALDEFYLSSYRHKDGTQSPMPRCKQCTMNMSEKWRLKNWPELSEKYKVWHQNRVKADPQLNAKRKIRHWEIKLDLPKGWFDAQLERQNGLCAICQKPESTKGTRRHYGLGGKRLAIDHCHDRMVARGLLCMSCNVKLAVLEDADFIQKATDYLAKYQQ